MDIPGMAGEWVDFRVDGGVGLVVGRSRVRSGDS